MLKHTKLPPRIVRPKNISFLSTTVSNLLQRYPTFIVMTRNIMDTFCREIFLSEIIFRQKPVTEGGGGRVITGHGCKTVVILSIVT